MEKWGLGEEASRESQLGCSQPARSLDRSREQLRAPTFGCRRDGDDDDDDGGLLEEDQTYDVLEADELSQVVSVHTVWRELVHVGEQDAEAARCSLPRCSSGTLDPHACTEVPLCKVDG